MRSDLTRIAFDISALDPRFKSHAQRGIGRYVRNIVDQLRRSQEPDISLDYFDHNTLLETGITTKLIDLLPMARTTLRQQLLYPLKLNSGSLKQASFIHFPAHMDGPAWSPKPYILTVHDLIPLIMEPLYRANRPNWRYEFARWLENSSIRNAALLIAVSETTARDVVRLLNYPRERIVVTPEGIEESFFELYKIRRERAGKVNEELRTRLEIPRDRKIVFYVGGHDERKNTRAIVEIARETINECLDRGLPAPVLVLAGKIGSERERECLHTALRDFAMAADTINLGFVSEDDLKALLVESSVFLFPSLYEGFGLPVLEASAAGLPVVSSNRGSLPEVLGSTGLLFDPEDSVGGAAAVLRVLRDENFAHELSESGFERARTFSWERTLKLTLEAYRYAGELARDPRAIRPVVEVGNESNNLSARPASNAG